MPLKTEENKQTAQLMGFVAISAYINTFPNCIKHKNQGFSSSGEMK